MERRSGATIRARAGAARSTRSATARRDAPRMKLQRRAHRVLVPGFRLAGVRAGLKQRGRDVALIAADRPASVAGVFTTNRAPAAPVQLARPRVVAGPVSAVLVHAGNANACTGAEGLRTASDATALAARLLGVAPAEVVPCATGRIGVQVPRERLLVGVRAAAAALTPAGFAHAAEAITTTDAFPKTALRRIVLGGSRITVAALGKGAGMIAPDMATLLVFVVTDAAAPARVLRATLGEAVDATLNAITVVGDVTVARRGRPVRGALGRAAARMRQTSFRLELDLHLGTGTARMLASDLSPDYVRFNAEYTT